MQHAKKKKEKKSSTFTECAHSPRKERKKKERERGEGVQTSKEPKSLKKRITTQHNLAQVVRLQQEKCTGRTPAHNGNSLLPSLLLLPVQNMPYPPRSTKQIANTDHQNTATDLFFLNHHPKADNSLSCGSISANPRHPPK